MFFAAKVVSGDYNDFGFKKYLIEFCRFSTYKILTPTKVAIHFILDPGNVPPPPGENNKTFLKF
jgi:hypothetical protein